MLLAIRTDAMHDKSLHLPSFAIETPHNLAFSLSKKMRTFSNYCFCHISFFVVIPVLIMQTQCEKYKLKLSANYTLVWHIVDNEYINFAALVQTNGWIGLGLNSIPSMDGADLIMTGIGDNKRPYLHVNC